MMTIMLVIIVMLMIIYIKSVSHTVIKSNRIQQSIDTIYAGNECLINSKSIRKFHASHFYSIQLGMMRDWKRTLIRKCLSRNFQQ